MNDQWQLFKVVGTPESVWKYLLVQEDEIVVRFTSEQARKVYRLLEKEFKVDQEGPVFDRT